MQRYMTTNKLSPFKKKEGKNQWQICIQKEFAGNTYEGTFAKRICCNLELCCTPEIHTLFAGPIADINRSLPFQRQFD